METTVKITVPGSGINLYSIARALKAQSAQIEALEGHTKEAAMLAYVSAQFDTESYKHLGDVGMVGETA